MIWWFDLSPCRPRPTSKLDRCHTGRRTKRDKLLTGGGKRGGRGACSFDILWRKLLEFYKSEQRGQIPNTPPYNPEHVTSWVRSPPPPPSSRTRTTHDKRQPQDRPLWPRGQKHHLHNRNEDKKIVKEVNGPPVLRASRPQSMEENSRCASPPPLPCVSIYL